MGKLIWVVTGDSNRVIGITTSRNKAEKECRNYVVRRMRDNGYGKLPGYGLARIDRHKFDTYTKYVSVGFMLEARARGYTMGEFDDADA